jgi:hypothetical protein
MPHRDLSDDEAAPIEERPATIDHDGYLFSERIRTLNAILAKLRPEPARAPLSPPKAYAPEQQPDKTVTDGG